MVGASRGRFMRFGERVRDLRTSKGLSQRTLGKTLGVSFTYVSKIENEKLDFGDYPSEQLICKIAKALEADPDELLLLAKKLPSIIRKRLFERPEVFQALARCDDRILDSVLSQVIARTKPSRRPAK